MGKGGGGSYVFIRDPEFAWVPATKLSDDGKKAKCDVPTYPGEQEIICDAGTSARGSEEVEVPLKDYNKGVLPMQNVDPSGMLRKFADMVELPFLHEAGILYNLKDRHVNGLPYTRTGDIIIAVNPFQWFKEIYTEQVRSKYSKVLVWENLEGDPRSDVDPHVYETSSLSYKGLAFEGGDQSILVSGESGAGKTETVKIAMNHIASVQRGPGVHGESTAPVLQRVLESNPLLEAFGNAKTRRNDNSSRFGKYCQLQFDMGDKAQQEFRPRDKATCVLAGSKCEAYLLEKNRVTMHDPAERTYHIFYQIIAAKDKANYWSKLAGATNESFRFVGTAPTDTIEGLKDGDHFKNTVGTLQQIKVKDDKLMTLMQAIIIVLQLGNLTFGPDPSDDEKSVITSAKELTDLSELMCIPDQALQMGFTERTMKTRNETYKVPLKHEVALESAEAFAREIYGRAFLWLVRAINDATAAELNYKSGQMDTFGVIGLLDIFGFESFVRNRFEQLCINYANEKLQAKFTEDIFRSVQEEYKQEGIPLDEITYDDNTDVLDLIEGKTGLLAMLNEECVRPKGTDEAFVTKALAANKKSPCIFVNKINRMGFGVHHFAGKVMYDAEGFVAANQDTLPTDLSELANLCSNEIIAKHMTNDSCLNFKDKNAIAAPAKKSSGPKRAKSNLVAPTVWGKYKTQLASLMAMLRKTNSRYIRCIKPHPSKKPWLLSHVSTIEQLRCAGVVAAVTLSRSAFPNRLENSTVRFKFWQLWDREKYPSKSKPDMPKPERHMLDCQAILACALEPMKTTDKKTGKEVKIFCVGKTRSYFKFGMLEYLESHRSAGLEVHAIEMQRLARAVLARKKVLGNQRMRKMAVFIVQKWMRRMIAKMAAKIECEKQRKRMAAKMEELKKKREEQAHMDKIKQDIANRENSAKSEYSTYDNRLDELKTQLADAKKRYEELLDEAVERKNVAVEETQELTVKLETEIKHAADEPAKIAAAQKTKLAEQTKMIGFLQKENKKLKAANDKAKKDVKKVKETNTRLMKANEAAGASFEMLNASSSKLKDNSTNLTANIENFKKNNAKLREDLKKQQAFYNAEAQIRLQYQKTMAQILDVFQDNCKDADLVEEIVCIALECESEAKSLLAAAEAAAPGI